jgi:hypothetical protein
MQGELDAANTTVPIKILAINEAGHESGNEAFTDGRDLPLLQEASEQGIWDSFRITYRDVIIVDATGVTAGIYNLTENSLNDEGNYDTLKQTLLDTANSQ